VSSCYKYMHRLIRRIVSVLVVGMCSSMVYGQDDVQTILWAGIAFRGNVADTAELLPLTKSVVNEVGLPKLNTLAWEGIQRVKRNDIRFSQAVGKSTSGNAIALALALDFEQFQESVVRGNVCAFGRLWAQVLVFDFSEKKLIGAFPLRVETPNSCERDVTVFPEDKKRALVRQLLFEDASNSILSAFEGQLADQQFHSGWQANIKVTQVALGKYTKAMLKSSAWSEAAYRRWLAATFAAAMTEQQRIPVLPYSLGGAIAGAMPLRFEDDEAFDIALPPEDYAIKLTARGYVEKILDQSKSRVAKSHIFSLGVDFYDPDFNDHYLNENMNIARTDEYANTDSIDVVQIYEEITSVLVSEFLSQFPEPDKAWVKKHVKSKAKWEALRKSFETVDQEIFANIRGD
jgi:hypothetical protein